MLDVRDVRELICNLPDSILSLGNMDGSFKHLSQDLRFLIRGVFAVRPPKVETSTSIAACVEFTRSERKSLELQKALEGLI
jgi:hypothetical protein